MWGSMEKLFPYREDAPVSPFGKGKMEVAVKVERVAGRDHDAHDVLARAHVFELRHEGREGGFGRGRAEYEPQFMGDVAQQLDQREPGEAGDDVQDDKDEQQAGQVEAAHEIAEGAERAEAVLAHGEGHSAERAERGL